MLTLDGEIKIAVLRKFIFEDKSELEVSSATKVLVEKTHRKLLSILEKRIPVYGVTTGFGDSCFRFIPPEQSEELQRNLISYLSCGTGAPLSKEASKASFIIRLQSLCRGYSGVSFDLIERMKLHIERDWIPVIPQEGSLGASGDLIPLAYIAASLQGNGEIHSAGNPVPMKEVLAQSEIIPYKLKPKEGLALVNGTSCMAGLALVNLHHAEHLLNLVTLSSSWLCMALRGRVEAFSVLVNEKAKKHRGQALVAKKIRGYLDGENYKSLRGQDVSVKNSHTEEFVQDKYSLRCVPQILGPVFETIEKSWEWLEQEVNSASDNPLISEDGTLEMGGNFYGGYLAHSMDYIKICFGQMADLIDRQLAFLIDDKVNRGLPANLADWPSMPENERFLHHGLKGLHQGVSAVTSEILNMSIPNSIFSRSSESHNQDKVSLGMSAAVRASEMIEKLYTIQAMYLICLTQALDLRQIELKHEPSRELYRTIRNILPKIQRDMALGPQIKTLAETLKGKANKL